jgi:selenide,water dikinase
MMVFLAAPVEIPKHVLASILNGMEGFIETIGGRILGGHTIINPWVLVGGMVSAIVPRDHLVGHAGMLPGDELILTKPLGTQPVMALARLAKHPEDLDEVLTFMDKDEIQPTVDAAIAGMTTSNLPVSRSITDLADRGTGFAVHAMTDVTGFGLAGHAENLAVASGVDVEISRMPHLAHAVELAGLFGYPMKEGRSAETAGGMLLAIALNDHDALVQAMDDAGIPHFVIGRAMEGSGTVSIASDVEYLPV